MVRRHYFRLPHVRLTAEAKSTNGNGTLGVTMQCFDMGHFGDAENAIKVMGPRSSGAFSHPWTSFAHQGPVSYQPRQQLFELADRMKQVFSIWHDRVAESFKLSNVTRGQGCQ